jgi:hypothetical protein
MAKKLVVEKAKVLWKDRRRRFGLPLSFTRYEATEERLITRKGLFNTTTDELMIFRISDIRLVRGLGQKIFGVGTITLISSDKSHNTLELKNIKHPDNVRVFLSDMVEKQREVRGITGREFFGNVDIL